MKTLLFLLLAGALAGQKLEFEVASIRPATDDNDHDSSTDRGFYRTHNLTLKRLIEIAYHVDARLVTGGPPWINTDSYDINAKIPEEFAAKRDDETVPRMIQSLLAARFQLVLHREPSEIAGYALVVSKKGAKLQTADAGEKNSGTQTSNSHMHATNITMAKLAVNLSRNRDIGKLVADKTGLPGAYTFELEWAPERPASTTDDRPGIFTALQQQLGLKLEPAKIPVESLVIDRAQKPEGN